ncbi:MAG: LacI family transcriptional regulator [Microbacteriaceae bacterium]|nr:LacI family transcriptional regulator [Microbacteriaceae bacterium]
MATTIRQVAAEAGVSIATASRALGGSSAVVEATRERVLGVAAALNYTPSRLGRSLATGSTGNVGVILPDVTNPFYTSFLAALESALGARDLGILVGDSHESLDGERALIRRMDTQVDALVLASSRLPDAEIVAASHRLPVVLANRRLDAAAIAPAGLSQIALDVGPGFAQAAEHLHSLGHTGIVYVDGPPQSWSGRQKRDTLTRACARLGMRLTIAPTVRPDFEGGRRALEAVDLDDTTAIVAFNDQVALGLLSALREAGVEVPTRVSIVGCDDSLPHGLAWPPLTTVDSSSRTLGELAAAATLGEGALRNTVPTHLIVRDSTGACPAASV